MEHYISHVVLSRSIVSFVVTLTASNYLKQEWKVPPAFENMEPGNSENSKQLVKSHDKAPKV